MAILWGGVGADTLTGGAEENTIGGGAGNDRLTGNNARDQIFGGDGNDTITGGGGNDYLEGGAGRDTFVLLPGDGWDYIGDFQAGAGGDVLDLTAWTGITDFGTLLALATSDGNDTILTFSPTASVRLAGVARSALTADNVTLAAGSGMPGENPDTPPPGGTLSLGPATVSVAEGSGGGTTNFLFTVTRSGDVSAAASVNWSTAGAGASAAGAADFVGDALPSGVVTFAAGQSTATIAVPVRADTGVETDEGFTVTLSAPSTGWTIAVGSANGLIVNDDAAGGNTPGQALTGTAARDELYGTAGNDTIVGGAGNDYMEGGAGSDRFVINAGDGWDAIGDFQAGSGGDVLDLRSWGLTSAAALLASATEDSGGTVLNLSSNTGVRLMGVSKASLTAANFQLAGSTNQPPVAHGQALTTDEDRSLSGQLSATDPESGSNGLSYSLVEGGAPQHGAVTINRDGSFTYTPGKDYFGADRFTFQVTDAGGLSSTESVALTVNRQRDDANAYFTAGGPIYRVSLDQPGGKPEAMSVLNAQAGSGGFGQMTVMGSTLFATTSNQTIRAFDLDNPSDTGRALAMPGRLSVSSDGKLYSFDGSRLYSYDPTQPETAPALVADVSAWGASQGYYLPPMNGYWSENSFLVSDNTLFFSAGPVTEMGFEFELCRLDLGTPGAEPVRTDLFPGTFQAQYYSSLATAANRSSPASFTEANGGVYFSAATQWAGRELLQVAAGNSLGGANLVDDLYEGWSQQERPWYGMQSSQPRGYYTETITNDSAPQNLTEAGGDLFFTASTPENGRELYRLDTDHPGATPTLVADLMPGSASSTPTNLMSTDTALYFSATTAAGQQFLRYDLASGQLVDMAVDWSGFGTDAANRPTNFVSAIT
ncbi:Ig-like domain-containing protein [Azospirillum doebereinerae]|uniref:Ig-like domain-containing protein n=1 Tax=Azospirillum doebereinerae TaxID=92933 RepID=UPI0023681AAD|nr:Ig-like domain-containing protein [Azospirillum doebereinerae]